MALDIGAALRDGADRTVQRTGVVLMVGFAVLGLVTVVLQQTYLEWYFGFVERSGAVERSFETPPFPLSLGLSPLVAAVAALGVAVVAEAYRIVAVRTMVGDHTDRIPASLLTRNIGLATLNGFVGGVVVLLLIGVGSVLLVVPGVFLAVTFLFVRQEIAVRDVNFVDAMVGSWRLTSGERLRVLVLGIVWVTALLVALVVNAGVGAVLPADSPVSPVVGVLLRVPVTVFVVASAARAYVQLDAKRDGDGAAADGARGDDDEDDGEEWNDPPGVDI